MDVRVELLADDLWAAEDYKTGFLSVGVDSSDQLYLKNDHFPCPWCKLAMRISEKVQQIEIWDFLMNDPNIVFGLTPLWKN